MAKVQSKNTGLEEQFIEILRRAGIRGFIRSPDDIPGKPDITFRSRKIAVFVDSCFWHGCPKHLRRPSTNRSYWQLKIDRNIERDRKIRAALRRTGWRVIRVWEHDMKRPAAAIRRISRAIEDRRHKSDGNIGKRACDA